MQAKRNRSVWGVPMTIGVLMIIGGAFALCAALLTSIASVFYIGASLLVVGGIEVVGGFGVRERSAKVALVAAGLLAALAGVMLLAHPIDGLLGLTLVLAAYLFTSGLFRGVVAIGDRYSGWGWDLAYGLISLVLGVYVALSWPLSSAWVLGTVVGAEILARGVAMVAASLAIRDVERDAAFVR